ncbi:hypothetical protein HAX54_007335 [Datura stramonium]|uniref:Uncharacterized protein n=1 Tax=Datura stramonium TaxID=4076 RepID=A0ABS8TCE4_DATST|nr:hypothetical protein [Datura stramonium]
MEIEITDSHPRENGFDENNVYKNGSKSAKVKHIHSKESTQSLKCSSLRMRLQSSLYMRLRVVDANTVAFKILPCLFNQNPADIADADDERYLRSVEDQRIRDRSLFPEEFGVVNVYGRKRQRTKERLGSMPIVALKT